MDGPQTHVRSTGTQVNLSETRPSTTDKPTLQHIVEEEAILQLMKNCPMCNRQCRCNKHTRGPYLIVYQSCYFCDYQRKWASQPEAKNINIHKKKPLLKDRACVITKALSIQLNRIGVPQCQSPMTHVNPEEQTQPLS